MANIQMEVIPEPDKGTASVLVPSSGGPQIMLRGDGDDTYICGCCGESIYENVQRGQIVNLVFKCFNCGSFNRVRGT